VREATVSYVCLGGIWLMITYSAYRDMLGFGIGGWPCDARVTHFRVACCDLRESPVEVMVASGSRFDDGGHANLLL